MSGLLGGGGDTDIPTKAAENIKRTAEPVKQLSDAARKNRRRQASSLTRGFLPPMLGEVGLTGVNV